MARVVWRYCNVLGKPYRCSIGDWKIARNRSRVHLGEALGASGHTAVRVSDSPEVIPVGMRQERSCIIRANRVPVLPRVKYKLDLCVLDDRTAPEPESQWVPRFG